ncbi:MAG: hypothetical protein OXL97_13955 [Chloroflexota bacterium]|nr:hypothetical protein [Chloroflexota bacterium]MDE2884228.1 hypothetical protein [Chloroflexota bacterium]
MLTTVRMSLRASVRSAISITMVLLLFAAFAAACGDPEPTATPTPRPTPTPTPTATPTPLPPTPTPVPPTATPESAPDTTMPEPEAGSVQDLVITESTTVGDLMAVLSESEVSCIRDIFGEGASDAVQGMPLAGLPTDSADFPIDCLATENVIGISVAMMSGEAGGLSAETRSCITALAMENPAILGIGGEPENPAALFGGAIQMQLCLTEEEAAAFAESSGAMIDPAAAQCLLEQLGGEEGLTELFSGEADETAIFSIFAAAQACEIELGGPSG